MWWILQNSRFSSEKNAISKLESEVDWLELDKWQSDNELVMSVTFQVRHLGNTFRFRMKYPSIFPDAPPMIFTVEKKRISLHQYGADGEVCLEYRPDNWQTSINGADMIMSLHRLITEEQNEDGYVTHAHSAHISSLGRDVRATYFRFLVTETDLKALNSLGERKPEVVQLTERRVSDVYISSMICIGESESPIWKSDLALPNTTTRDVGFVVRIPNVNITKNPELTEIKALLERTNLKTLFNRIFQTSTFSKLIVGDHSNWNLLCIFGAVGERRVISYRTIQIPENKNRLAEELQYLTDKKVGLVGCGSVGSKIGASLCRTGVGNFLLIDEDIFFPGNAIRNELDLTHVGLHKAQALKERLHSINPNSHIQIRRLSLGGQESASSMSETLELLGKCDIIIDATANPEAFTWIASVSTRKKKPLVWLEVFGGGIGGIVARSRPNLDPIPLLARAQILQWCNNQGVETQMRPQNSDYNTLTDDGIPMIADDAEVSIVSSHATRFVTDILARPDTSLFPFSAYVVGMSSEWIFQQPFDTRPINLLLDGEWGESTDNFDATGVIQLLEEYLPKKNKPDENNTS